MNKFRYESHDTLAELHKVSEGRLRPYKCVAQLIETFGKENKAPPLDALYGFMWNSGEWGPCFDEQAAFWKNKTAATRDCAQLVEVVNVTSGYGLLPSTLYQKMQATTPLKWAKLTTMLQLRLKTRSTRRRCSSG